MYSPPFVGGDFRGGEIFKLSNLHPLPIPLPSREREVILTLRNTCY